MGRWIAIGTRPGWDDIGTFGAELGRTEQWRVDARTSITTVMVLGDGRTLAECHANDRRDFEAWLERTGWTVDSIYPVKHIAKAGSVWNVG